MKRTILERYDLNFDYHDYDVAGYLIGGELSTDIDDSAKKTFRGDWSEVTFADVWSWIHNGDRQPVTFWADRHEFVTYYPRRDDTEFLVVRVRLEPDATDEQ